MQRFKASCCIISTGFRRLRKLHGYPLSEAILLQRWGGDNDFLDAVGFWDDDGSTSANDNTGKP